MKLKVYNALSTNAAIITSAIGNNISKGITRSSINWNPLNFDHNINIRNSDMCNANTITKIPAIFKRTLTNEIFR